MENKDDRTARVKQNERHDNRKYEEIERMYNEEKHGDQEGELHENWTRPKRPTVSTYPVT